jgi:hypothetical protein
MPLALLRKTAKRFVRSHERDESRRADDEFIMHRAQSVLFILCGARHTPSILSAPSFSARIFPPAELYSQLLLSHPK